ncbi:cysteine hydrolase [Xanthobacter sp. KR7-225]|uniref:cysteine hydrolase n=1 Tax=Xanthobacter sp. KR7-225 TaxID=3156613 RepID=UPI0032B37846
MNGPSTLPDHVIARVKFKRGRLRVFERFDLEKTAVLVVDMQRYYLPRISGIREIVPKINDVVARLRARGATIAWIMNTLARNGVSTWPFYHAHFFNASGAEDHRNGLMAGAPGHALISDLIPTTDDLVVEKTRFSAFAPNSSELPALLRKRGAENLIIVGTATNVCCESTARDAMMQDYRVVVLSDATAAITQEDHLAGLSTLYSCFADVMTTDELLRVVNCAALTHE